MQTLYIMRLERRGAIVNSNPIDNSTFAL